MAQYIELKQLDPVLRSALAKILNDVDAQTINGIYLRVTSGSIEYSTDNTNWYPVLSAAKILELMKTVDGNGSGLDADTVRGWGIDKSALANTIAQRDVNGDLTTALKIIFSNGDGFVWNDTTNVMHLVADGSTFEMWASNNMGSGSGMDSDKVDGLHFRMNGEVLESSVNGTDWKPALDSAAILASLLTVDVDNSTLNANYLQGVQASQFARTDIDETFTKKVTINDAAGNSIGGTNIANGWLKIGSSLAMDPNEIFFSGTTGYIGVIGAHPLEVQVNGNTHRFNADGSIAFAVNNLTAGGHKVWTAGNMGSGSNLDADKVDGIHLRNTADDLEFSLNGTSWFKAITDASLLAKLKNVDGSGSGLESDKLDGYHLRLTGGTFEFSTNGTTWLPAISAADLLAALKTVDGTGSGLDADTIDGYGTTVNSTPNSVAIRDASGNIRINTQLNFSGDDGIKLDDTNNKLIYIADGVDHDIWSANNQGAGSGMDADTVDGLQGSQLARKDTANTFIGSQTVQGDFWIVTSGDDGWRWRPSVVAGKYAMSDQYGNMMMLINEQGTTNQAMALGDTDGSSEAVLFGISVLSGSGVNPTTGDEAGWTNRFKVTGTGKGYLNGHLIMTKGNDGAGSGFDADLLDGQHGDYYLAWANITGKPDPVITVNGDASGSVTLTDMASGTLTLTIADDSHNHTIANVDGLQGALDGKQATFTAADVLAWLLTVDGASSQLDADKLDGQEGSYYLAWANVTGKPDPTITVNGDASGSVTLTDLGNGTLTLTIADDSHNHTIANVDGLQTALNAKLASSAYTAADVLAKLLTVDGSGSQLDADKLDGQEGSYYLAWANITGKPDPVITLNGDASGSVTLTDMGSGTLTVTIADDSHNHVISNIDGLQAALDGKAATHSHPYINVSGNQTLAGELTVNSIRQPISGVAANTFVRNHSVGAVAYFNQVNTGVNASIARFSSGTSTADTQVKLDIRNDGSVESQGHVKVGGAWTIKKNTDGSLGFYVD